MGSVGAVLVALVGALALSCGLYVLLTYVTAFLLSPAPRGSVRLLRAACVELGTTLLLVPLWPLWWLLGAVYQEGSEGAGEARGRRNPVILLHGFGMNRTQWIWMARRLRARGHGPIYGLNYFSLASVDSAARSLSRFVDQVLSCERRTEVDLVAHSMGGLVARHFIERLSGARKVGRLITIGTPHHGTRLGRFGLFMPAARDLCFGSSFLSELGLVREGSAYTSIWSRADAVVQPAESSSIAPAGVDEIFDDLGHLSLVLSPRVVDVIDARLRA